MINLARGVGARWQALFVAVLIVLAFGTGAAAKGKYDAKNAARVDSKQAVAATSSAHKRAGKLVATGSKTGLLPNNIIAKAPDSSRLGGYSHQQLSAIALPVQGAAPTGDATVTADGVAIPNTADGGMSESFVLPPDYRTGDAIYADLVYEETDAAACSWALSVQGLASQYEGELVPSEVPWLWAGSSSAGTGTLTVPAGQSASFDATFRWSSTAAAGQSLSFGLTRTPSAGGDSCGNIRLLGLQIRY